MADVPVQDVEEAFTAAAPHADRFIITTHNAGIRMAFLESPGPDSPIKFRTAVLLSYQNALELRDLLTEMLKPVESRIVEAAGHASGTGLATGVSE